ncbi:hypothetical protein EXN22_14650 [Pseudomonas tructae]|uniref:Lipoprotein n=1 Tax=Pseudomonas tructae TaxID=2518644 RepID=A0A411MJA5_9PSED|nr:hypothetical protein [Pseudomonas tructae]QBF26867.1 hypothetical protein EXN22_14650 [Pseudomonas tructae]
MRILIGALAVAVLAGCASMGERRAEGPAKALASTKAVNEVSECVLFAWQEQSLAGAHYDASLQPLPGGGKTVVSAGQVEFADFKPVNNGTKVEVYFQSGLMDWRKNRRTEAVQRCL